MLWKQAPIYNGNRQDTLQKLPTTNELRNSCNEDKRQEAYRNLGQPQTRWTYHSKRKKWIEWMENVQTEFKLSTMEDYDK